MNQEDIEGEVGYLVFCCPFKDFKLYKGKQSYIKEEKKYIYIPVLPLTLLARTLATLVAIRLFAKQSRRGRLPLGKS